MAATSVVSNARARAHAAVRADITGEARRQLAVAGAASLSLRAVARELGMASSAMYRYFTSRDELLTALIVEGYDAMGEVAETAAVSGGAAARRFRTVCRAIRGWALDHPHEYALLYGAPVPGYHAPELTTGAAIRVTGVLAGLVHDAHQAGELSAAKIPPLSRAMAAQTRPIGQAIMPGVPLPSSPGPWRCGLCCSARSTSKSSDACRTARRFAIFWPGRPSHPWRHRAGPAGLTGHGHGGSW